LQLRCAVNITDSAIGVSLLLIVLAVALAADVGAYYVGSAIGRHRLAPWVSPGKTVEGSFGGLVASITVAIAFWLVAEGSVPGSDSVAETGGILSRIGEQLSPVIGRLSFLQVFVFGLVTSVCAQMGDLFESLLKRSAQVKDSSGVIPGMGGVLDVIDGVIFAAPAAWFLMTFVWEVV
jgi:phosphatidate cytidylyltransferase